eukprot:COSAG02_NODE_4479_length_5316_cov_1484.345218_2_plen_75_part_00
MTRDTIHTIYSYKPSNQQELIERRIDYKYLFPELTQSIKIKEPPTKRRIDYKYLFPELTQSIKIKDFLTKRRCD